MRKVGGDVQAGDEQQRQKQEGASSPQTLSRWGHKKKVCCHGNRRAPTTQGWQLQLVLQGLCSSFFYPLSLFFFFFKDDNDFHFSSCTGRGRGFVLTRTIFFDTRFHNILLLLGDAPGHMLGPLPYFTLYPSGPLQPPGFYLSINMPVKFTLSTQVLLESLTEYSADCLKFSLDRFELLPFFFFFPPPYFSIFPSCRGSLRFLNHA